MRVLAALARLLKQLPLGGPDGELNAAMRYLNQRYAMPMDIAKGALTDIGTSCFLRYPN